MFNFPLTPACKHKYFFISVNVTLYKHSLVLSIQNNVDCDHVYRYLYREIYIINQTLPWQINRKDFTIKVFSRFPTFTKFYY